MRIHGFPFSLSLGGHGMRPHNRKHTRLF
jgi:hypothetical protein